MTYCRNYTTEFGRLMASLLTAVTDRTFYPEPRDEGRPIDHTRTDWELFRKHCLDQDYNLVGDMWVDAAWPPLFFLSLCGFLFLPVKLYAVLCNETEAKMGNILDYLVSSTRVMSNLPGHWANLTRVKYPSNLSKNVRCVWIVLAMRTPKIEIKPNLFVTAFNLTRRRMARERRGAGSSLVSMETPYYKTIF